jgi:hypothetical protein
MASGPASGTYTANPSANRIGAYMYGGGGGSNAPRASGTGGDGGGGFWSYPISSKPFSQPYSVGGFGTSPASYNTPAPAGGATNITNVGTANGGNGAFTGGGNAGTQPGSTVTVPRAFRTGPIAYRNNQGFVYYFGAGSVGTTGDPPETLNAVEGALIIYENIGT